MAPDAPDLLVTPDVSDNAPATARVAVVTGASAGIGRAIAVALGGLGWTVGLGARRVAHLEETAKLVADAGGTPLVHVLDVTEPESIDAFFAFVRAESGPIQVLVNNAGTAVPGSIHEMADDDHRRIVETNLLGPMLLTRRIVAQLRADAMPGDIVFISSDATVNKRPDLATYLSTKAGLEAFAQVAGARMRRSGDPLVGRSRRADHLRLRRRLGSHHLRGVDPALAALRYPAALERHGSRGRRAGRGYRRDRALAHVDADRRGPAEPPDYLIATT